MRIDSETRKAITEAIGNFIHAIRWNDRPKKEAMEMGIQALEQINKITDLLDGTIDHFDRDDAIDLLYEIKEVIR